MTNAKELLKYSKKLNVLYVEDDDNLREETVALLSNFFTKIDTAKDGKEGLELFENNEYNIVITDIRMPNMDGIEMSDKILEIDPEQHIIIISAHDETKYLLQLINMGISHFMLKPLDMQNLINTLYKVSKTIANENLILSYQNKLENTNAMLTEENRKLEKALRMFDAKIAKDNIHKQNQKSSSDTADDKTKSQISTLTEDGLQKFDDYVLDNDIQELGELETEIDSLTVIMILNQEVDDEKMQLLSNALYRYGQILASYPIFETLGLNMMELAETMKRKTAQELTLTKDAFILMESFIFVLLKWKKEIFETGISDPNMYDASMISDMKTIMLMMEPSQDDSSNVEFF